MLPKQRTWLGIAIAVLLVPVVIGLAACLPVPIGDPERSRLDPEMTGIWTDPDGPLNVTLFQPYDKRTWLVTMVVGDRQADCPSGQAYPGYDEWIASMADADCASAKYVTIYKAWRSKHGKRWFLTMEPMALIEGEGDPFGKEAWFVYRIDKTDKDAFELYMINPDFEGFKGLPEKRRAYEKVIRKHVADEDMYSGDSSKFVRVKNEHVGFFGDFVEEIIDIE